MTKKITLLLLLFCLIINANAQHIGRRAFMGASTINITDSVAQARKLNTKQGLLLQKIFDNGSAIKLGLKEGDIILYANELPMINRNSFLQLLAKLKDGDAISLKINRDGKEIVIKGKLMGALPDKYEFADVIYDEIAFEKGYLRNIIIKPKGKEKCPVVFFIQGYNCASIDNMGIDHPYEKVLTELVKNGIAVFKIEKPGMGDCMGTPACEDIDFYKELKAFETAYKSISTYSFLDTNNIFIFGHSMGGVIAPIMNRKPEARGIAVYGTVTRTWLEYFIEMSRFQQIISGEDYKYNEQMFANRLKFNYEFFINKKTPVQLAKDSAMAELLKTEWQYQAPDRMLERNYQYWQQLQDVSMINGWADYSGKVLSMWGESDFVAFSKADHQWVADIVNRYHPGNGKFVLVPKSDHAFTYNETLEDAAKNWTNRAYRLTHYNDTASKILLEWINSVRK